jgi:plastocyanin
VSQMRKRVLVFVAAAAVVATSLAVTLSSGADAPREVVLEIRGMAFYMDGAGPANPVIQARPGELLRVTVRNADAGLVHDFAVTTVGVVLRPLQAGASGSVVFRAPRAEGSYEYVCQPHAQMMRGQLDVVARP